MTTIVQMPQSKDESVIFRNAPDVAKASYWAKCFGLSTKTIIRAIQRGSLPGFTIGRNYFIAKNTMLGFMKNGGELNKCIDQI